MKRILCLFSALFVLTSCSRSEHDYDDEPPPAPLTASFGAATEEVPLPQGWTCDSDSCWPAGGRSTLSKDDGSSEVSEESADPCVPLATPNRVTIIRSQDGIYTVRDAAMAPVGPRADSLEVDFTLCVQMAQSTIAWSKERTFELGRRHTEAEMRNLYFNQPDHDAARQWSCERLFRDFETANLKQRATLYPSTKLCPSEVRELRVALPPIAAKTLAEMMTSKTDYSATFFAHLGEQVYPRATIAKSLMWQVHWWKLTEEGLGFKKGDFDMTGLNFPDNGLR